MNPHGSKLAKAVLFLWTSIVVSACLLVAMTLLPYSPLRTYVPINNDGTITRLIPQGWGFFTKDPQEARVHYYSKSENAEWKNIDIANSDLENIFGASRSARLRGIEYGSIISQNESALKDGWKSCESTTLKECANEKKGGIPISVNNAYPVQSLCGSIKVLQQEPNPFAYHQAGFANGNPIRVLSLDISCDSN